MDWPIKEVSTEHKSTTEVLTFDEYANLIKKNPKKRLRNSAKYLKDMFDYFGKDEQEEWNVFTGKMENSQSIIGNKNVYNKIYQKLNNFVEEGFNNKFILLVGPNGSSKTSIVERIMKGAENYSNTQDGALYTFSWIFPIDNFIKGKFGLNTDDNDTTTNLDSFAKLKDVEISAILSSELKDDPFLLIPKEYRNKFLGKSVNEKFKNELSKTYLITGDLSKRNRMIYDALLKNYNGDHFAVLKHVRVERFIISKRYSSAAVTIEPQLHVDAKLQQITMDKRLASLPPSLQSLNLFSLHGETILANRGILEFSDLLKRPIDAFKYLLMTIESKNLNIGGILTELDILFIGTSNEMHLQAFRQHPDFKSFKGRFDFIKVPYLLNYRDEIKIYQKQIETLKGSIVFEPHSMELLAMFAVMTRIRHSETKNYTDKKLANILTNLNPLDKILFIADFTIPEKLNSEQKQLLSQARSEMLEEYISCPVYEGKFGISPRDIKNIIYHLAASNSFISFQEVIDYLQKFILKIDDYDFLSITPQGDYHNPSQFLKYLSDYAFKQFDFELRESLGIIDDRSYEQYIKNYIGEIKAILKDEKIKNKTTGMYENNLFLIKEFESSLNLKESVDEFRSHLLSKLGAYSLDHPGDSLEYIKVFPEITSNLKEAFRNEQSKFIKLLADNLMYFKDSRESISTESLELIERTLDNLINKFGYSKDGALNLIKSLINEYY